jgi:flavodoxin
MVVGMRALVVYESMFGNTELVARQVADGLAGYAQVEIREVSEAPSMPDELLDLVVLGGPTHAFSMSRESTREDARRQGATHGEVCTGLREWLDGLPRGAHHPMVATFDTRVTKVRRIPGSAARRAAKIAGKLGYPVTEPPESFFVEDIDGPLSDGELERARAWGDQIGAHFKVPHN